MKSTFSRSSDLVYTPFCSQHWISKQPSSPARIKTHMDILAGAGRPITKFLPQSLLQENVIVGNAVLAQHESISAQINHRLMQKNKQVWMSAGPRWGVKLQLSSVTQNIQALIISVVLQQLMKTYGSAKEPVISLSTTSLKSNFPEMKRFIVC